ncbi:hypothetical protein N7G274_001623 [Stereocaulon virgatum]|uniref:Uncharacterized protein n=1 Tax=Stereocaulon virgatum TaxID=373712 RepID=A0ABR4AMW8_9LECA
MSPVGLAYQGVVPLSATPSTPSPTRIVQGQVMPVREPQDRKRVRELWGQSTEEEGRGAGKRQCTTSPYRQQGW